MSGVETAGLVLGAFPLVISAMEHFEETKRVTSTWWRIKRAHKKDVGRVKDCQLKFKLNLKELLLPMLLDDVVNKSDYERLLASPGGVGWKEEHVNKALAERLAESHERYVEILHDMVDGMARLSKAFMVDDATFQEGLRRKKEDASSSSAPNAQAQTTLMLRANEALAFEAKRIKYAFAGDKRDDLLAEIERCNAKLQDVLASNDRVSALAQATRVSSSRAVNPKTLTFWKHAANIFELLDTIWHCHCRSAAHLWLQRIPIGDIGMKMWLNMCSGGQSVHIRTSGASQTLVLGKSKSTAQYQASSSIPLRAHSNLTADSSHRTSTATMMQTKTSTVASGLSTLTLAKPTDLKTYGLCKVCSDIHHKRDPNVCIGMMSRQDCHYAVYPFIEQTAIQTTTTLAELLRPDAPIKLKPVQRYGIALTLASSHLQLHSTPWLREYWTADDVCFPITSNQAALHGVPYILAKFDSNSPAPASVHKDRSFSTLGIVLLELCFGSRLGHHRLWQNPLYAPMKADPMMRHAVACEWLDEVPDEAGEDYATAVRWTLKQAPVVIRDDKWRVDFAQNVVQPLQRYYEYLNPPKGTF